mmetsp:Transcript_8467/g.13358  ORF Transcript_8467/g.13358 Transcript_8467/m.13358 type:complete len:96 (+) Transcript_8467:182-469(+)|eukprot:CAMPEP_0181368434 /NCGR_PEP_ID=MMETSP1106-20121128/12086_1 /TAXON_ID=81844 /ORGANISM="Mantoniella antarctica, Strain SL-175" /LENGTH=95 /DNA_ID=CAMNT_0023484551 /DNA_START=192 /DNA_END=479 /DNA_ORIENTATION=-
MTATLDDYDLLIYPGFMRRPLARWNEDGSCAPVARARGPKGEAFQLMLKQAEIDEDISHIEHEIGIGKKPKKKKVVLLSAPVPDRKVEEDAEEVA